MGKKGGQTTEAADSSSSGSDATGGTYKPSEHGGLKVRLLFLLSERLITT
jgi:hypothetical protein